MSNEIYNAFQSLIKENEGLRQRQYHSLPASEMVELRNAAIKYFYHRVCRQAEKLAGSGVVSDAHLSAMQQVLAQMRIEVDDSAGAE